MALQDILQAINTKTQKEIDSINANSEKELSELETSWNEKIENKRKSLINEVQKKVNDKIRQSSFSLKSRIQAKITSKKQENINDVFEKALKEIINLPEDKQVKFLSEKIQDLPEVDNFEIFTGKDCEKIVSKALKEAKRKISISAKNIDIKGGFIAKSPSLEIDNSYESEVASVKDKSLIEITRILFS